MKRIPSTGDVLGQVERILAQPQFAASSRLCAFLRFIVEKELAGRGKEIKEYSIGVSAYQKSEKYDPRLDPTVRVDARKLRARLGEYYEAAGRDDPILITIPKGTYVPVIEARTPPPAVAAAQPARQQRGVRVIWGAAVVMTAGMALWSGRMLRGSHRDEQPPRILTLTSFQGEANSPSLSPDGSMVAFSWNGEGEDNYDVYVKVVDAPNALRLTSDPARDEAPAWSPDGRQIAFLRNPGPSGEVYVVSALGGEERRVTKTAGKSIGWTCDSKGLLIADLVGEGPYAGFLVSLETGERRQITFPTLGSYHGDYDLAASPDGKRIVYCRMAREPVAELWVMPAERGRAEKITESRNYLAGVAWTPNSRNIIFSSLQNGFPALWKVEAKPSAVPQLMAGFESDAVKPSIPIRPGGPDRVAYQHKEQPYRLWRAGVAGGRLTASKPLAASQGSDALPQISPSGERIAFASNRFGSFDILVCGLDGTGLRNLTAGSGLAAGSPRWSPDGNHVVFEARDSMDNRDIYRAPAGGGQLQRLTTAGSEETRPSWSANGEWIYFTSDRTGIREVWKMPAAGGSAGQVTRGGGFEAFESVDGAALYYLKGPHGKTLWRKPAAGGVESSVLEDVRQGLWSATGAGIYYVDSSRRVCLLDGKVTCMGQIERWEENGYGGFSVSRNGKDVVYARPEPARPQLRMAEGMFFR